VAERGVIDDPHYTTPIYGKTEAARIVAIPTQTFRDWALGTPASGSMDRRSCRRPS
jgi:hypothetical protein